MIYIATFAFFMSLLMLLYGLLKLTRRKEKVIDKLDAYDEEKMRVVDNRQKPMERKGPIQKIAKILEAMPTSASRKKKNALTVKQADLPITIEELFVVKVMSATSLGLLFAALTQNPMSVLIIVLVVWLLPMVIISSRKKKKIKEFDEQLNEGLGMISNALKAGYSFLQALAVAAEETQNPFSKEFKGLIKELSLGIPMEDGLNNLVERVPSEDLKLIINAIMIQKDVGGNLSEVLENIAETIRERQRIKNEVSSLTAQGKLSGIIIMAMPFVLAMVIYLFDNDYILTLFQTLIGRMMLIFAVISQIIGWLFIRKIINIEY